VLHALRLSVLVDAYLTIPHAEAAARLCVVPVVVVVIIVVVIMLNGCMVSPQREKSLLLGKH
jgi:hypothetical protein